MKRPRILLAILVLVTAVLIGSKYEGYQSNQEMKLLTSRLKTRISNAPLKAYTPNSELLDALALLRAKTLASKSEPTVKRELLPAL